MTAFNVVRMRVKPGRADDYLAGFRALELFPGMRSARVVRTGERDFCVIGEWDDMDAIVAARPAMTAVLDGLRDALDDLGGGLGVTDPVSGELVVETRR